MFPVVFFLALLGAGNVHGIGMFKDSTNDIPPGGVQLNYGVAVTNVGDGRGPMEWVIAGYNGPNTVLQLDEANGKYINIVQTGSPYEALADRDGSAIGVCACDIDGDGLEEIYFLNINRYSGRKTVKDRLFKWRNGRYEDLFEDDVNKGVPSMYAGRSVACVDRTGSGKYGILLATYAENSEGKFSLVEMDAGNPANNPSSGQIALHNVAETVGIDFSTGGRGITVGPILGDDGFSDIYFVNEGNYRLGNRGDNALFKNDGTGHFTNVAGEVGLDDSPPGRGVALADFNNDEKIDIVYGNWETPHRLQIQGTDSAGNPFFQNVATKEFETPSPIRTVIAADFDNSGVLQVFMNNIVHAGYDASNKLYRIHPNGTSVSIVEDDIGDAKETDQYGTGAAVSDTDGDGVLELLIAHGESKAQSLSFYRVSKDRISGNNWLRVLPLTQHGAPARGSKVTLTLQDGTKLTRVIDGGSGYLCEMEPVAHFGLGQSSPTNLKVTWPDGHFITKTLTSSDKNKMHKISFTGELTVVEMGSTASRRSSDSNLAYETRPLGSENPSVGDSSNQGREKKPVQTRTLYNSTHSGTRTYNSRYWSRKRPNFPATTTEATRRTYYRQYPRDRTSSRDRGKYIQGGSRLDSGRRPYNYYGNRNNRYYTFTTAPPRTTSTATTGRSRLDSRRRPYNYYGNRSTKYYAFTTAVPRTTSIAATGRSRLSRRRPYNYYGNRNSRYYAFTTALPRTKSTPTTTDKSTYNRRRYNYYGRNRSTYTPRRSSYVSQRGSYAYHRANPKQYRSSETYSRESSGTRNPANQPIYVSRSRYSSRPSNRRNNDRISAQYSPTVGRNAEERKPTATGNLYHSGSYRPSVTQDKTSTSYSQRNQEEQESTRRQLSRSQSRSTRYEYPQTRYQPSQPERRSRYPQTRGTNQNRRTQARSYSGRQQLYAVLQPNNPAYPTNNDKYLSAGSSEQSKRYRKTDGQDKLRAKYAPLRQDALENTNVRRYSRYYSSVQES